MCILLEKELEICEGHIEKLAEILRKMQQDEDSVSEKIKTLAAKKEVFKTKLPFWLDSIINSIFFAKKTRELLKEFSKIKSLQRKLEKEKIVYYHTIEKIKVEGDYQKTEDVIKIFFYLIINLLRNPSVPSIIPHELFQIKTNFQKRNNPLINDQLEKGLADFIKSIERRGYA